MKKESLNRLGIRIILLCLTLLFILFAFYTWLISNRTVNISVFDVEVASSTSVNIYEFSPFAKEENLEIGIINENVIELNDIISRAIKIDRLIDVIEPNYVLEFIENDKITNTIYVWINNNLATMIRYEKDLNTLYAVLETDQQRLNDLIINSINQAE